MSDLDIQGQIAVSGSYGREGRIWDLDMKVCSRVLKDYPGKIYALKMDGWCEGYYWEFG